MEAGGTQRALPAASGPAVSMDSAGRRARRQQQQALSGLGGSRPASQQLLQPAASLDGESCSPAAWLDPGQSFLKLKR